MDKNQFYLFVVVYITTHVIRTIYEYLKQKEFEIQTFLC